jgi:hypothetical protein
MRRCYSIVALEGAKSCLAETIDGRAGSPHPRLIGARSQKMLKTTYNFQIDFRTISCGCAYTA